MDENDAIGKLRSLKRTSRLLSFIAVGCIAVGFISVTTSGGEGVFIFVLGMVFFVISALIEAKYKKIHAEYVLIPTLKRLFPDSSFELSVKDHSISKEFDRVGMLRKDSDESITNFLTIKENGHTLKEFSITESHTETDSDGDSHTVYTFHGTQLHYDYATGIDGIVRILSSHRGKVFKSESTFLPKNCKLTPDKIETGNAELDESFEIYASTQHLGFYVLNPVVIEKLKTFRARYGDFGIAVTHDDLFISFKGTDRFIKLPSKPEDINDSIYEKAKSEIYEIINMLNDMGYTLSKHVEKENIF